MSDRQEQDREWQSTREVPREKNESGGTRQVDKRNEMYLLQLSGGVNSFHSGQVEVDIISGD